MFQFQIPNKKLVTYQVFAYGILLLNIVGLYIYMPSSALKSPVLISLLVIGVLSVFVDFFRFKKKKKLLPIGFMLLLCGMIWMFLEQYHLMLLNIIIEILYIISIRKLQITVSKQGIQYPSFPEKKLEWHQINNIILKDDIITIDLVNNKIYQHLIEYLDKEVNEAEFNDFCKQQLVRS